MQAIIVSLILLGGGIFTIIWNRDNIIKVFLGAELCLLGANWNFFCSAWICNFLDGYTFVLFVLAVAAAEIAVGLGLSVLVFYRTGSILLEKITRMRG